MKTQKLPIQAEYWLSNSGDEIAYICGFDPDGDPVICTDYNIRTVNMAEFLANWHHEPRCTGFDWQPPSPIDPVEGWEVLPVGTVLQDGDEYLNFFGVWIETQQAGACIDGDENIYRRMKPTAEQWPKILLELGGVADAGDTASIAGWDEVLREIKRVGAYQTPVFADNRTASTIRHLGGWIAVCDKSPEELHQWTRQHFLKTFAAMPATAETRLSNLIERENARTGMVEAAAEVQQRIGSNHHQQQDACGVVRALHGRTNLQPIGGRDDYANHW